MTGRIGDSTHGCQGEMFEAGIWIAVVFSGVAVLGVAELVRSSAYLRARGEEVRSALPFLFLVLLVLITGSVSVVFFFLYFLASVWQFSLAVLFMVFIFLVARIRKEQTMGTLVAQPGNLGGEGGTPPTLFNRVATLAVEAASAAMLMVFMVPFAAGGFLMFRFYGIIMEAIGLSSPVFPLLMVVATIVLPYYLIIKRRARVTLRAAYTSPSITSIQTHRRKA